MKATTFFLHFEDPKVNPQLYDFIISFLSQHNFIFVCAKRTKHFLHSRVSTDPEFRTLPDTNDDFYTELQTKV